MSIQYRQTGVALITVLLVVFLATIAATALSSVQQLTLRRSTLHLHLHQARLYALGAEQWATAILQRDRRDNNTDHLGEDWASLPPALPVEGGSISGHLEDLQGRFHLNNLLNSEGEIDPVWLAHLERLLEHLELESGLTQAIVDWIDPDQTTRFPDGAEDETYLGLDPPYLSANAVLLSVSELRLIKGINQEAYNKLAPLISTLPSGTAINVNTVIKAPVLAALSEELDLVSAQELIDDRERNGYNSVDAFLKAAALADFPIPKDNLSVASGYFQLRVQVQVGSARATLNSVFSRPDQSEPRILMRNFGSDH